MFLVMVKPKAPALPAMLMQKQTCLVMELQFFIILLFRRVCSNAMVYAAMFISWAILWNFVQPDILLLRSVDLIT